MEQQVNQIIGHGFPIHLIKFILALFVRLPSVIYPRPPGQDRPRHPEQQSQQSRAWPF